VSLLAEEDAPPPNASINVVLFGALAKDFDQAVNQGVGSPGGGGVELAARGGRGHPVR